MFRLLLVLCVAVGASSAVADVDPAPIISGQSVPNVAADAEMQADFADGFVTLQDERVMITLVRDGAGDITFDLPDGSSWAMLVLLNPPDAPGYVQVSTPVQFNSIDNCHVSLPTLLGDAVPGDHAVAADLVEFDGEAGAAVPISGEAVELWTPDNVTMVITQSAYGGCFTVGNVRVCYNYGERADGSKCLKVFVYYRDENGQWTRVLKLDTGWVEPNAANSVVTVGPFNNPLDAFNAAIEMMKTNLLGHQPAALDLWNSIEGQVRTQVQTLVESGAIPWPDSEE